MSQVKFMRKPIRISLEEWTRELNTEGTRGWKLIQIFTAPSGHLTAVMRKDL